MKKYSSVIIGHVSVDENVDYQGNGVTIPGGAVLYSSASAWALGHNVLAVTRFNAAETNRLEAFTIPRENIRLIDSPSSTTMYNRYLTADKERRICVCRSAGTPFTADDVQDYDAEIYHFAGLIYGDFNNDMIRKAASYGKVAVDVQTCLRHADMNDGGNMFFTDWADKLEMLPLIDFLKTDAAEAEIMTGTDDRVKAAEMLYGWGAKEILITHNTEVLAYDGDQVYTCPIRARNLSGRTGRGDTTFAAYINERTREDVKTSLLWATATVSLKMETPGPLRGTRKDVEDYIRAFYPEFV